MGGERRVVRVGTRKSPLALWQTRWVIARLQEAWPGLHFEEVPMVTQGDLVLDRPLDQAGGRGLFVAEMEEALLAGRIDLAVHSMKDLPIELAPGLVLGPVPPRADRASVPVRGNLGTRLRKLEEGQVDGLVLAAAGLARMGYELAGFPLEPPLFLPAVGQGALALELRADDPWLRERLAPLGDP